MYAVGSSHEGGHRIGGSEAAVAMAVPVHANLRARRFDDFFHHELHQRQSAHGSGVSGGVAEDDGACAAIDRSGVEALDHFRIAPGGVLGDVHDFEAKRHGVFDGLLGGLQHKEIETAFSVAT